MKDLKLTRHAQVLRHWIQIIHRPWDWENQPETTVAWHLASDSGKEARALTQQGGSEDLEIGASSPLASLSSVICKPFLASPPAMCLPPKISQPLVQNHPTKKYQYKLSHKHITEATEVQTFHKRISGIMLAGADIKSIA